MTNVVFVFHTENKKSKQYRFTYNDISIAISTKHGVGPPDLLIQLDSLEWVMTVGVLV